MTPIEQFEHGHVRCAGIWPTFGHNMQPSSIFKDAVDCMRWDETALSVMPKDFDDDCDMDDVEWDSIFGDISFAGKHGYMGIFECPVYTKSGDSGASFSWGCFKHRLFYATSVNELLQFGTKWGDQQWDVAVTQVAA